MLLKYIVHNDTLSKFLVTNGFKKGVVDRTLFTIEFDGKLLLAQVYVDDIIFGSEDEDTISLSCPSSIW